MAIDLSCPACEATYSFSDDKAGRRFRCKSCKEVITVPDPAEDAATLSAEDEVPESESKTPKLQSGRGRSGRPGTGRGRSRASSGGNGGGRGPQRRPASNLMFVAGAAAVVALVGALLWAAIMYFSKYEIGWLAWGIGAACGAAAIKFGGFGARDGLVVGAIAVAGILLGKSVGMHFIEDEGRAELTVLAESAYAEYQADAEELRRRESDGPLDVDAMLQFIADRGYSEGGTAAYVEDYELQYFKENSLPELRAIQNGKTKEKFVTQVIRDYDKALAEEDEGDITTRGAKDTLFDIVFIVLGFGTAVAMLVKQPQFIRREGAEG